MATQPELEAAKVEYIMQLANPYTTPLEEEPGKSDTASAQVTDKEKVIDGKTVEKSEDSNMTDHSDFLTKVAYIPTMEDVLA